MERSSMEKTKALVGMAIFTALVVVLQQLAGVIKIGTFTPSLVLVPIVIGAAAYGMGAGAYLGLVFGILVLIGCISGTDLGGAAMWSVHPLVTAVICLGKGIAAGAAAGAVYRALAQKNKIAAAAVSAIVCPIVNTGLFAAGMLVVFRPMLQQWAEAWMTQTGRVGSSLVTYLFLGMIGVNFLIEVALNLLLSPVIVRILNAKKR